MPYHSRSHRFNGKFQLCPQQRWPSHKDFKTIRVKWKKELWLSDSPMTSSHITSPPPFTGVTIKPLNNVKYEVAPHNTRAHTILCLSSTFISVQLTFRLFVRSVHSLIRLVSLFSFFLIAFRRQRIVFSLSVS